MTKREKLQYEALNNAKKLFYSDKSDDVRRLFNALGYDFQLVSDEHVFDLNLTDEDLIAIADC